MANPDSNKPYQPGEVIFQEGEPGDCAYIIEEGEVNLFMLVAGQSKLIAKLKAGHLLGEMCLIDHQLRSATAIAVAPTRLIVIPGQRFQEKIASCDQFIMLLVKVLLDRYREMRARLENISRIVDEDRLNQTLYAPNHYVSFQDESLALTTRQLEAENALREAFTQRQFELFYQPILALQDNALAGCEALIRWRHPVRGLVPPIEFIGLAEETGLIVPMGQWIIEQACAVWRQLEAEGIVLDFIGINLSSKQFEPLDFVDQTQALFIQQMMAPRHIKFEITESILMANPMQTVTILNDLKQLGCHIAIDDFGTGYSSFSYLHRFPIDTLKIDKSFVSTMLSNPKSFQIVKTLCLLARSIGLVVVAEGIESEEEHHALVEMGVDYGQGYYYAKPLPYEAFRQFIIAQQAG